ncbi:hypothetical protein BDR03DRAFT_939814, partial [Suillus americanus]
SRDILFEASVSGSVPDVSDILRSRCSSCGFWKTYVPSFNQVSNPTLYIVTVNYAIGYALGIRFFLTQNIYNDQV